MAAQSTARAILDPLANGGLRKTVNPTTDAGRWRRSQVQTAYRSQEERIRHALGGPPLSVGKSRDLGSAAVYLVVREPEDEGGPSSRDLIPRQELAVADTVVVQEGPIAALEIPDEELRSKGFNLEMIR